MQTAVIAGLVIFGVFSIVSIAKLGGVAAERYTDTSGIERFFVYLFVWLWLMYFAAWALNDVVIKI